jgi:hypothetical protein
VNVHVEELDGEDEVVITGDAADPRSGLNGTMERSGEAVRPPEGRPVT